MGIPGSALLITVAASRPFIKGMARSITTKSGFSWAAFSMASTPFAASPHTRNCVSPSTAARMVYRVYSKQYREDPSYWPCWKGGRVG
jgi:hypothetical protein